MQTAGLSDRKLVPRVVAVPGEFGSVVSSTLSHDSISEPRIFDHSRFSLADSIALLAASVAAPSSLALTNVSNCQE